MAKTHPSNDEIGPSRLMSIIETQTNVIRFGHDINAIMALVTDRATDIIPAAAGAVIEMAESDEMVYRAVSGLTSDSLGLRLQCDSSLSGLCVARSETLYCEDTETDPRVDHHAVRTLGISSMLVAPLNNSGLIFGVLKAVSPRKHAFSRADIRTIELLSDAVAASLSNAIKYSSNELLRQATTDHLTGIGTRVLLTERLRAAIAGASKIQTNAYLLVLDMDGLKGLNDEHGHRVGDAAIIQTAQRIKAEMRETDTVVRLGGDEFAVLIYPAAKELSLQSIARRLSARCNQPLEFEGETFSVGASVGYAIYPDDVEASARPARQAEMLLDAADRAMYREKRARRKGAD